MILQLNCDQPPSSLITLPRDNIHVRPMRISWNQQNILNKSRSKTRIQALRLNSSTFSKQSFSTAFFSAGESSSAEAPSLPSSTTHEVLNEDGSSWASVTRLTVLLVDLTMKTSMEAPGASNSARDCLHAPHGETYSPRISAATATARKRRWPSATARQMALRSAQTVRP